MKRLWDRACTWMRNQTTRTSRSSRCPGFPLRMECPRRQWIIKRLFSPIGLVLIKKIQYKHHGQSWRTVRNWHLRSKSTIQPRTMPLRPQCWSTRCKPIPNERNKMLSSLTQNQVWDQWGTILTIRIKWAWTILITQRNSKLKYRAIWIWTKSPILLTLVILHEIFKSSTKFRSMQNQTQHSITGEINEEEATIA